MEDRGWLGEVIDINVRTLNMKKATTTSIPLISAKGRKKKEYDTLNSRGDLKKKK